MTRRSETPNPASAPSDAVTVRSEEQLRVATEWSVAGRLRVRRRIVSEVRTIEVTVRREELVLDTEDVENRDGAMVGTGVDSPSIPAPPLNRTPIVVLLREEVPIVTMTALPYETVTITTTLASTDAPVNAAVQREKVALEQGDATVAQRS